VLQSGQQLAQLVLLRRAGKGRSTLQVKRLAAALLIAVACMRQQPVAASDGKCRREADCASGFCDRGACQKPSGVYGRPCTPGPGTKSGLRAPMPHVCGAYLCLDGRCRSCNSDEECRSELGSPRCYKLQGEPGRRCGNPANGS